MTRPTIGSLCSGYGGLDVAVEQFFDAEPAWFAEYDDAPSRILAHHWPDVPNYGDMTAIDWATVPKVDIVTGGTPCQDLSAAGARRGMTEGTRSNLWVQMRECIATVRPAVVVWENVRGAYSAYAVSEVEKEDDAEWYLGLGGVEPGSGLLGEPYGPGRPALRALHRVLGDLSALGFDAEWVGIRAADAGAPHARFRVFVVAYDPNQRLEGLMGGAARWGRGLADGARRVAEAVALLPTVTTQDGANTGGPSQYDRNTLPLNTEVTLLPTPAAGMPNDSEDPEQWQARHDHHAGKGDDATRSGMPLAIAAKLLPTPVTEPDTANGHARNLGAEARALLPTQTAGLAGAGNTSRSGARIDEKLLNGIVQEDLPRPTALLPTPRASRGASNTETMYALGGIRDDEGDEQGNVILTPAFATDSVAEYERLWASLEDQSPFWVTAKGVDYWPAIRRWAGIVGRPAPSPTLPDGKGGKHRLNAKLAEWMMGQPDGHITSPDIGLTRNEQLKACGNGVVTQQAFLALTLTWPHVAAALAGGQAAA
jgi:DNA (cytosine-5)-methyltransferase 1